MAQDSGSPIPCDVLTGDQDASMHCPRCHDTGCVCENHPDHAWAGVADVEECCGGAGMPCPDCCSEIDADGRTSITVAFTPDRLRG